MDCFVCLLVYLLFIYFCHRKVTMETKEAAEAAVYEPNPIIDGRKANVNLAYLGVKSRIVQPTSNFLHSLSFKKNNKLNK